MSRMKTVPEKSGSIGVVITDSPSGSNQAGKPLKIE